MNTKKEHLANFQIAGFTYYDGALAFKDLKIGTKLKLKLDADNKYDARAVAIYYKDHKLGYIPKAENRIFYKLFTVGLQRFVKARIQRISKDEHPENQIQVVAHIID
ncbi:HIRAN domain-containing protein [Epilithonimonas sp. JDS]|uniref:HIRAN domain-containing protein n=1 Tax=Epilithonimonas sp. JDS TaxID=2902797 RepID=UPI001E3DBED7|nr:HIRAN domain-containing protein [Epilithonimonas sp. JDS]MCD9854521.1 HIRAN domain-containing protein [Epilithonimonas sp. JDS]